ncbi:MAG: DUF1343 domain-containing protein [Chloroflexi bacterium]|nr:DUF1343 domain-containing protein [Chloroflexota bacterium]
MNNSVDARTGLPVYSLYSEHTKPAREMFDGLDLIVVDLQDIGARCYTFAWTMSLMLEACAEAGLEMLVLDRPNPSTALSCAGCWSSRTARRWSAGMTASCRLCMA